MKFLSPAGTSIIGTLETVPGTALASHFEKDGAPVYDGETKIHWDDQKTVWNKGSRVYVCEDGEEWTFDQLTPEPEDDDLDADEEIDDDAFDRMVENELAGGYDRHTMNQD